MVQVSYNGLKGTHLITQNAPAINVPSLSTIKSLIAKGYNFNATVPNPYGIANYNSTSVNGESNLQALAPFQNFYNQSFGEYMNRAGSSIYNALYVNMTHQYRFGFSLQGSFAWANRSTLPEVARTSRR